MDKAARILITGAGGMVGQALARELGKEHKHVIAHTRKACDLEDRKATLNYFLEQKPDFVFHLAAKVGGIKANMQDPVGFMHSNALISCHVLEACHQAKVKKTLVLGSSCVFPRECPQPMKEEYLMTGPLEPTNEGYAFGKIMALKLAKYYEQQYKMKLVCPMASNLYGPEDSFDLEHSHMLSALVRRFVDARESGATELTLWGTGKARRELLHTRDAVHGLIFFMNKVETADLINLGPGDDASIAEIAALIADLTGFKGKINWDTSKPDGMPRKCMDVTKLNNLGFKAQVSLRDGVQEVIAAYERIRK